eukprot:NODE_8040_length_727_cov_29.145695_g7788_i0.p1 GENE.NODE_8040_length_727_cov_29.145695_g7788_i0~~NODE_8040_length_727_cov_29.145695_g7788_i0.p1  ORF type:complete len:192 (-),score=65.56 NODE_8040_length_727_cov_29.145695_g7788_i0:89-664(-)
MFVARRFVAPALRSVRAYSEAASAKRYDLFGYEVSTATGPFIAKIAKCQYYDDAGEVIVEMNLANCPPDLATYNALLARILECKSKQAEPVTGESKVCAMMDILEEMDHRYSIKPNAESWSYVVKALVAEGDFRLGWLAIAAMKAEGFEAPADLVSANQAQADKAKASGSDFPAMLRRPPPEGFDTKAWGF